MLIIRIGKLFFTKSFITFDPGANVIKLILPVTDNKEKYARAFVRGNPFHPRLIFISEAYSLPMRREPERFSIGLGLAVLAKIRSGC